MYLLAIVIGSTLLLSLSVVGLNVFDQSLCQQHFYRLSFVQLTQGLTLEEEEKSRSKEALFCQSTKEKLIARFQANRFQSQSQEYSLEQTLHKKWMNQDW